MRLLTLQSVPLSVLVAPREDTAQRGPHGAATGCHVTLSYLLMLVVMTYSVWLCIAVVAGAVLGFFLFNCWPLGWIGQPPPAACHLSDDDEATSAASSGSGHVRKLMSGQTEAGDCCH